MNHGNRSLIRSLSALYALLLRLYPAPLRQAFGDEMAAVFRESLEAAGATGTGALLRVAWRELLSFPSNVVAARRSVQANPGSPRAGWRTWIAWVFLSTLAIPAAWAITFAGAALAETQLGSTMRHGGRITPTQDVVATYLFFPAFALILGGVQWAVLRPYVPRAARWLLATTAGWLGGFALIYLLAVLERRYPQTLLHELQLVTPLLALCLSIAQWLALRDVVARGGWIVLANVLGFAAVRLATDLSFGFVESLSLGLWPAISTGLVLIWLLRRGDSAGTSTVAGTQEPKDTGQPAVSRSRDAFWLATMPARNLVRLALLLLWIVAILGPWTYTLDGVPPPEWCDERYVLIAEDRCADLISD
jgi:hypothetical protein